MTPASRSAQHQRWLLRVAWLLLTIYFVTPAREAYDQSLDKSNYATYAYFLAHGQQWGRDVIPMTGPFGFILYGHTYSGQLFGARLVGDFLLKAVFAALLLHLFRRAAPGPLRWVWLTGVILMLPCVDDLFHDFAILVATLVMLANLQRLNLQSWLAAALLGALALFKGTHLLTTAACFGSVGLLAVLERRWRALGILTAVYLLSLAGWWLVAGQNLAYLPVYLKGVLELSSGYNASMGLAELPFIRATGLALVAGLALNFAWVAAHATRSVRLVVVLLLLAGFTFIKWKHGYLRADGHVFIFFAAAAVIVLTLWLAGLGGLFGTPAATPTPARRRTGLALVTAVTGLAVLAAADFWLWRVYRIAADAPEALVRNMRALARPAFFRAKLDAQLELNRREAQVPQIQNEIGRGTVDFFGFEQGLLLLNGLNYHPRPMGGGSFNVFTAWLQERNEAFVRDPKRAPQWQVLKLQTLDDRLPSADDPLTLRAILEAYSPVLMQRDYMLFKRRANPPPPGGLVELGRHRLQAGDPLAVPDPGPGRMVLFRVQAPLSVGGTIRSMVYRRPELRARLFTQRSPHGRTFVLKPTMLRRPAILSPLLVDNLDVIQLFSDKVVDPVKSLQLVAEPGFDAGGFTVIFYSAPRPLPPEGVDAGEIITYWHYPVYNRTPMEIVTQETGIRELNKEPISLVHAPGSITWDLQPGDQQMIFSYGLMPQAYLDGGKTNGVEFNVEVLVPGKKGRVIFRRLLQPLTVEADRDMQRSRVFLPPYEPGARLRIRTHPGLFNDGAYDQSYVARVQFKAGPIGPYVVLGNVPDDIRGPSEPVRQAPVEILPFQGLGVPPADGQVPDGAKAAIDSRPVFLVHAPGSLVINIPDAAREVSFEIGMLPGAYSNGGGSDGVGYTFAVIHPDGTRREVGRKVLQPGRLMEDRGPQYIHFPIPTRPAGSQLGITTDAGPNGDRSWDHSYVAGVKFH